MSDFDPSEETKVFLRLMAQHGVETTVVWKQGAKVTATSNQGAEGLARAAATLTIKNGTIDRAARALHTHMTSLPGEPTPPWDELNRTEQDQIRLMVKIVLATALEKTAEPSSKLIV